MLFCAGPFPLIFSFSLMSEVYGLLLSESRQDKENNGQIAIGSYNFILTLSETPPRRLRRITMESQAFLGKGLNVP